MGLRTWFPLGVLVAAACGGERPAPAAPPEEPPAAAVATTLVAVAAPDLMVRGTVYAGTDQITFRACDGSGIVSALDSTGGRLLPTYRFLRPPNEEGMYVLARAAQSPGGQIVLREIEFARRPVPEENCDQPAPDYQLVARGINPNWHVTVRTNGIEFAQDSEPRSIGFPSVAPDDSGGVIRYQASAAAGGPRAFHLLLTPGTCNEGRGVYASMQAALVLEGRMLSGCAWRGRLP